MSDTSNSAIWKMAGRSFFRFINLTLHDKLHLNKDRLNAAFNVDSKGNYSIFRETVNHSPDDGEAVFMIIGFRLRWIGSNRFMHWLFQRLCICTTPFWSGLRGFSIKLWMVDRQTKNYMGIYEWNGSENAHNYVDALIKVLRALSVPGSVWYVFPKAKSLEELLNSFSEQDL